MYKVFNVNCYWNEMVQKTGIVLRIWFRKYTIRWSRELSLNENSKFRVASYKTGSKSENWTRDYILFILILNPIFE